MTSSALLVRTYTCTQLAADRLSDALTAVENVAGVGPAAQTRVLRDLWPDILRELRRANAAAESLEQQLAGVPAPKIGD